jgi:HTH-type transcriptional regulator, competence development regulator
MKSLGEKLRELREAKGLLLREVAAQLEIDPSLLSKIERGDKRPTREQVVTMAKMYKANEKELMVSYLSERVIYQVEDEDLAIEALKVAEEMIKYKKSKRK